ncbi:Isoamyl acetate-hydrolyzing esterase 1-like protein [Armadillidium vulgare]|nr:Isoamyl acetate-hydrolyzing esterase 1-like protein [Armadillidium vulgare]
MARHLIWPKICILGDSLTQFSFSAEGCWGSVVADEFVRKADFIARGFSGYNTRQYKALLPYLEKDIKGSTIAGIFLGANDANYPEINPQQGVPLEEYKENLKAIASFLKNSGVKCTLMITPPALDEESWKKECLKNGNECAKTSQLVENYASACLETSKAIGIPCVDLHTRMLQRNDWKEFLIDGLHFSKKGSEFVASQIIPTLKVLFANCNDIIKDKDGIMPLWNDVSNEDPETSFRKWFDKHKV